jgi:hypothetical protein
MDDSNWDELMKGRDFVHGYAMSRVHSAGEIEYIIAAASHLPAEDQVEIILSWVSGANVWENWESRIVQENDSYT